MVKGHAQRVLVSGAGEGHVLFAEEGLSLWGGVDAKSSEVIDRHHPLSGQLLAGKVLAIPCGRGSCTGSGVLMELLLKGLGPSAIIINQPEDILTLGVLVADEIFQRSIPVIQLSQDAFSDLVNVPWLSVRDDVYSSQPLVPSQTPFSESFQSLTLSDYDQACLNGEKGHANQVAMRLIVRMAALQGADSLLDISQAHIDGCIYTGEAGLRFAEQLRDWGAKVAVPTSLNAISVDRKRWQSQGVPEALGVPSSALAQAYVDMGCSPTYTCAPYLLETAPKQGDQVAWAESNAVVFANSVLGARSLKYPDYLDICMAITGRAPRVGCHLDEDRLAAFSVIATKPQDADESFYPLLGYWIGKQSHGRIPLVMGLENAGVTQDDLKAFGAAFATTSSAPMFHILGITPEAIDARPIIDDAPSILVSNHDLADVWRRLNSSQSEQVDMVCLGNPHSSATEIALMASLVKGKKKSEAAQLVITCGRAVYDFAEQQGHVAALETFGAQWVTDTCWCMIEKPILPSEAQAIMTNSGKYAHYGPGISGFKMRFGSLQDCVDALIEGFKEWAVPAWLH